MELGNKHIQIATTINDDKIAHCEPRWYVLARSQFVGLSSIDYKLLKNNALNGSLVLVAALWGGTNPFIRRGTKGLRAVKSESRLGQAYAEVAYLLGNWRYLIFWFLNQLGSLVYLLTLQSSDLSLAVPVANSLAFVVTAVVGWSLGEEALDRKSMFGILLIIIGTMLCCLDKAI